MPIRKPGSGTDRAIEKPGSGKGLALRKAGASGIYGLCISPNGNSCDLDAITYSEAEQLIALFLDTQSNSIATDAKTILMALATQPTSARIVLVREKINDGEPAASLSPEGLGKTHEECDGKSPEDLYKPEIVGAFVKTLEALRTAKVLASNQAGASTLAIIGDTTRDSAMAAVNAPEPGIKPAR